MSSRTMKLLSVALIGATSVAVLAPPVSASPANEFGRVRIRVARDGGTAVVAGSVATSAGNADSYVTVSRTGVGRYAVRFVDLEGGAGSVVHLVQWGRETGRIPPLCQPEQWQAVAGAVEVSVACRDGSTGDLRDGASFDLLYSRYQQAPVPLAALSHAIADDGSRTTPYSAGGTTWRSGATPTQVQRTERGVYVLDYSEALGRTTPIVTAYGSRARWCQPASQRSISGGRRLEVRCFRPGGAPADAEFTATLTRGDPLIGLEFPARVRIDMPGGTLGVSENASFDGVNQNVSFGPGVQQVRLDGTARDKPFVVLAQAQTPRPRRCVVVRSTRAASGFDPTIGFVITRCVSGTTGESVDTTHWVARSDMTST